MMRRIALGLGVLLLAACASESVALPVETIVIDTHKGPARFRVEVANNQVSQERGLMYRKALAQNAGMIFDFGRPRFVTFWMKNTYIPLDMLFVRADGTISSIEPNAVPFSEQTIPSHEPIVAVIELNGGRAHDLEIEPGDRVHAPIFEAPGN
jgi:uncharacterized protein